MKDPEHQRLKRMITGAATLLVLVFLVPAAWLFIASDSKYRECVRLENDLYLGYEAVFDLSRPYLNPIVVPKFADGTPLIRNGMWAIYVTDTTIHGWALGPTSEEDYWFAWRPDAGLVRQQEGHASCERLIAEAGHANWDIEIGSVGTGWLLDELIKRPQFEVRRCATPLLTW